ncbi:MAG: carboxypeptidase regulatory-like domain-containing protein [Gemmatimonadaceae bacterium]|nr:carboxypeptidase regulatory-like domain-containing protein [Gemmatimonadaceae bacterium]
MRSLPLLAQGVDVIRGQVTGPENIPIESADVTATSLSGGVNRTARTDRSGRFTITFPGAEGDYFMTFTSIGYLPRKFEIKRTADQDILVADARLTRAVALLDTVHVTDSNRGRVNRNDKSPDIGGSEQSASSAAVSAAQQGDLNAMAATIPGVTSVTGADGDPAGFSVLGLPSDQNSTTLNGMAFNGANVPRDANVSPSLVTTPYDVSKGGFSGAQFNFSGGRGSNFIRRATSLNFDTPQLQWTDPTARALGQQYSNVSLGGSASGPISFDKLFYNVSYQLGRRTNDLHTLLNTSTIGLQATGLAADSVARLLTLLSQARIPALVDGRIPTSRYGTNGSVFGSIDFSPPGSSTGQTMNLTFNGFANGQNPASSLQAETPAHSGERVFGNASVQGSHTAYVKNTVLSESSIGVNVNRNYGTPFSTLPQGSVLVNSSFPDGTNGVRTIGFGGNPFLGTSNRTVGLSAGNQLSWFSKGNTHRLKFTSELRNERYEQDQTTNLFGSFYYNSLSDLQLNRPAFFSRSLSPRLQSGSQTIAALSLGDSYRRTPNLQLQYGVRVDGNRFADAPAYNPAVESVFQVRNDVIPNHVSVSPRVGISWSYGAAPQVSAFEGAARAPRAVIRGGVGVFQNMPGATLLGGAIDNTGLPSAVQQLTCIGSAAPIPDWSAYGTNPASIPAQCASGSSGSIFASSVPNVTLYSPSFRAQRSVRGNLQWNGPVIGDRFNLTVDGTYGSNLNQPSFVDLNFTPVTRFSLADEGGRPVYVNASSVVPLTGAIASRDARVTQQFARVAEQRSDLRSESRQLRFGLNPLSYSSDFSWVLNYVFQDNREQYRGFSSTAGSPLDVAWGRSGGFESRHQIQYNLNYNFFDAVRVNWFGRFGSGMNFTPGIAGDVNGDGYGNDRAYVFDPSTAADPVLGAAMRKLLTDGSAPARDCLSRQVGTIATRNSCAGPWTSSANVNLSFNPAKVRLPQRATLTFNVSNPLGAADILLHGENKLHGWGQQSFLDNTLLHVRGFDAAANRYRYEVNPRFGSTNPQFSQFRQPVTLTMSLRVDVGPSRERQTLTQALDRGRATSGTKATEGQLKAQYGSGGVLNPMTQLLRQSDTLKLTGPQADSLATMNRAYTVRLDSIWSSVARAFASMPVHYDQGEAYGLYKHARESSVDMLIAFAPRINSLLTAEQKRKLPSLVASHLDERYLAGIRSGTTGNTAGGVFIGGNFIGGGGGGTEIIIRH